MNPRSIDGALTDVDPPGITVASVTDLDNGSINQSINQFIKQQRTNGHPQVASRYVCMYTCNIVRCDRRTSNNKHKKQTQNDIQYKAEK